MTTEKFQDKCQGSLVGGAIRDALGYPVEFVYSFEKIRPNMVKMVLLIMIKVILGTKIIYAIIKRYFLMKRR